jgi:hypothetical protein
MPIADISAQNRAAPEAGATAKEFAVENPATGEVMAHCPELGPDDGRHRRTPAGLRLPRAAGLRRLSRACFRGREPQPDDHRARHERHPGQARLPAEIGPLTPEPKEQVMAIVDNSRTAMASVSAQYSIVLRVEVDHRPGMLGRVATAIGDAGGTIGSVDIVDLDGRHTIRDITVDTAGEDHSRRIGEAVEQVEGASVIDRTDRTFRLHVGGKIEQRSKLPLRTRDDLSMAYTPSVFNRDVADAVAAAVADQAKAQGTAEAHGNEIAYSPGETAEFRAIRP